MKPLSLEASWRLLQNQLKTEEDSSPNMYAILLLIGIRELGWVKGKFSKQEKKDLLHIAFCKILSYSDYYVFNETDQEGWPHWKLIKKIPLLSIVEQEQFIKSHILKYFQQEISV